MAEVVGDTATRGEIISRGLACLCPDGRALGLLQQILITTDGTVTHILEAYSGERMRVVKLVQSLPLARRDCPELELEGDERVLWRSVLLQGERTGSNYLYADSAIAVDRLEPAVMRGLIMTDTPVGKLLRDNRIETFREVLSCREEPAGSCADHFRIEPTDTMIARTYRIFSNGRPTLFITEKFPSSFFLSLP